MQDEVQWAFMQDPRVNWICNPPHKHREMRGITSAGRKYRGLHGKGHLHSKCRPSRRATWKKNNAKSLRRYRCAFGLNLPSFIHGDKESDCSQII
jgi:large subunit ribosomal protein L15e